METEDTAKEILEYCIQYLLNAKVGEEEKAIGKKRYKEMVKEIGFMIDTD
jgi:hypothetical protein